MRDLELLKLQSELEAAQTPYALATVIKVIGSASAKPGSKCLISREGKNLWGWVGGGCAESFTLTNALEAIQERSPRIILADLDDEVFGLGMPCGGKMEIYIEPRLPQEKVSLPTARSRSLQALAEHFDLLPQFEKESGDELELRDQIFLLALSLAQTRKLDFQPLAGQRSLLPSTPSEFLILGHSRITQELAKLGALLGWNTRVYGLELEKDLYPSTVKAEAARPNYAGLNVRANSFVVVASHHKGDHVYIKEALQAGAAYVGMVASPKRAGLVFEHLRAEKFPEKLLQQVSAPAGLRLNCRNPAEIALSIVAELIDNAKSTH